MTIEDVRQLVANGENRHLELKKTTGELKDGMHTACAFLNSDGGWLIFGVTPESLRIIGQMVNDNTRQEIARALNGLKPTVEVAVQYIDVPEYPGNQVIAMYFEAFTWGKQPFTYHGCPYYKVESTTKIMSLDVLEERLQAHKPDFFSWERQPAEGIDFNDLNEERVRGVLRLGFDKGRVHASALTEPFATILEKLQLLNNNNPNNAAVALFGTNVTAYPQFRLRMARFRGTDKKEFIDNQRVDGNYFDLFEAGMDFFLKHLDMKGEIIGFTRQEHLEIPAEALREALTNALCHRQFEKYNLTPSIAIFDDRIEIENPGVLPPQLTTETIKHSHNSYPYNPIIADVLFKATFLENWGTGTQRIIDVCKHYEVPEPTWNVSGGYICVTFQRVNFKSSLSQVQAKFEPSSSQVQRLIMRMTDDYLTASEMMGICGVKGRYTFRTLYVVPALTENAIERKYPDQPNHPKQQYRLTDKAKEWKKTNENKQ